MTDSDPDSTTNINRGGGADLNAQGDINIGGDVVGRDKITSTIFTGDQQYDAHGLANPYLGLQSFTYADHAKYAGREKLIAETVARLTAPDDPLALLFITGASGSGKSSFMQAGVLPALKEHYGKQNLEWAVFRPSRDPLAALSDAMWRQLGLPQFDASTDFGDYLRSNTSPQQVNTIVIDQFEELFTQSNAQPRDALFALLTHLPPFRSTRTHIIATVRADYLPELFALPTLYDIAKRGIDLRAMSVDELREAIQQPLRATYPDKEKHFQPELVGRLAKDAAEDAAYLPLLQVTLEEIWRKGTLTLGSYTNLADAIKQRADKVLEYQDYDAAQPNQPRSPEEQAAILNLCLDLVDVSLDDEARRDVRRRRSKDELISGALERARLIDALTQARLLSVSTDSGEQPRIEVDLIHETLLSNWDRLRQAIAERRHELRQRVRFEQQLKEWIGQNRSDDYMLSGVRLAEARDLERRDDVALRSAAAKDFVYRSVEREEARRQKELTDARRRVLVFSVVAIVALVAAAIAFFFGDQSSRNADLAERNAATAQAASTKSVLETNSRATAEANAIQQRDEAQRQSKTALLHQLGAQSIAYLKDRFVVATLLSLETDRLSNLLGNTFEGRNSLLRVVEESPGLIQFLWGHTDWVSSVAFSPNGRLLATGSNDKTIILWNMESLQRIGNSLNHPADVWSIAFSPDGNTLVAGAADGSIYLWDVTSQQLIGDPLIGHTDSVESVAFSPDGTILASGGADQNIILWDVASRQPIGRPLTGHEDTVYSVAFSPDGKTLASGGADNHIILWNVASKQSLGEPLTGHTDSVWRLAFSTNGETLASGSFDKSVILWDVASRRPDGEPLTGFSTWVSDVKFSTDGTLLASSAGDGTIILWDVAHRQRVGEPLTGHSNAVMSIAFSPDGKTLASGSRDRSIILWDLSREQFLSRTLSGHTDIVNSVAFSPDGKILASGSWDNSVILWDVASGKPVSQALTGHRYPVVSVAFSPDGKTLATGSTDNSVILWDVTSHQPISTPLAHANWVWRVAFSPDGKTLAAGTKDGEIIMWDVINHRQVGEALTGHQDEIRSLAFSPDGTILASGSADESVILWDVAKRQRIDEPLVGHQGTVFGVAFSPDGKTLASAGGDYKIILWDLATHQSIEQPFFGHTYRVISVAFSPDGSLLASGSWDDSIILWDTASHLPLGHPLIEYRGDIYSVAFSPDGKSLASGGGNGNVMLWNIDFNSWKARICNMAGRNLTRAEWAQYMGDEPYRKTCDQWPLVPEATPTP